MASAPWHFYFGRADVIRRSTSVLESIIPKPRHVYQEAYDKVEDGTLDWSQKKKKYNKLQERSTSERYYGDVIQSKGQTGTEFSSASLILWVSIQLLIIEAARNQNPNLVGLNSKWHLLPGATGKSLVRGREV